MRILGLYVGHDASVCIINDGKVEFALELERYSRFKHDYGFRSDFLDHCLNAAKVNLSDIDLVAANGWGWDGQQDLRSIGCRAGTVVHPSPIPVTPTLDKAFKFSIELQGRQLPAIAINHHLAHLACAYYTSPFSDAITVSLDGGGDQQHSAIMISRNGKMIDLQELNLPNIGMLWQRLCVSNFGFPSEAGFLPSSGPGKIMALAAYGKADSKISARFAADLACVNTIPVDHNLRDSHSALSQGYARALQNFTQECLESLFEFISKQQSLADIENICLSGGVALNCVATSAAFRSTRFSRLHVPPCPHDGGLALGLAFAARHIFNDNEFTPSFFSPYTGPDYVDQNLEPTFAELRRAGYAVTHLLESELRIAEHLADGEIIAVCRGRSEIGPRALGHRSLLSRPDIKGRRDFINQSVKSREWYRPLAPIILAGYAHTLLANCIDGSHYMSTSANVAADWLDRLSECTHIDGTTRPQVLHADADPWLHKVISKFHDLSGIPAVLNTSFNSQEPIVETAENAIATFAAMPIKYLLLEDHLIAKAN